jgi:hypothetical protein
VKVFTKFEDLPAHLRKQDSGVKFEDGWLTSPLRLDFPSFHDGNEANIAVRLTLKGSAKDAADFLCNIALRYDDLDAGGVYVFRQTPSIIQFARAALPTKKRPTKPKDEVFPPQGFHGAPNQPWTIEFGVVGSRLIARRNGSLLPIETDATIRSGRTPGSIVTPNAIRDIEVINLDGLPEAEALRILGVDEKGNDLRALAAKQEQQMAEQAKAADAMAAIPELKTLHEQFVKLQAERVIAPFEADVAKLNTGYLGGLDRKITEMKQKGDLDGVLALEEEKKAVTGARTPSSAVVPITAEADEGVRAPTLKDLRQIYRDSFAKLDATRAANLKLLTGPLTIRLKQLESTLTQQNRIDHAKTVREYWEGLGKKGSSDVPSGATQPDRNASTGGAAATMNEAGKSARAPLKKFPPGDDRKAAEWVLSVGGSVRVFGINKNLTDPSELPRGRFELEGVYLEFTSTNRPKGPIDNLLPLAGLKGLRQLTIEVVPLTEVHFEVLPSIPELTGLSLERTGATDALFAHLAGTNLRLFDITTEPAITGEGIGVLAAAKSLERVNFAGIRPSEEGLRQIGTLETLTTLSLSGSVQLLRDEHLPLLVGLKRLNNLVLRRTAITAEGLAGMKSWSDLPELGFDIHPGNAASEVAVLAKAFPKLEKLSFEGESTWDYSADDIRALAGFARLKSVSANGGAKIDDEALNGFMSLPKLERLSFQSCSNLTDAGLETVAQHKSLRTLILENLPRITDAGLDHLTGLKSLINLNLPRCSTLTDAAIAAFQKARLDVKVTR